jgi:hypothetical protein
MESNCASGLTGLAPGRNLRRILKVEEWQLQLQQYKVSGRAVIVQHCGNTYSGHVSIVAAGHEAGALSHSAGERCVHRAEPCELRGSDGVGDEDAAPPPPRRRRRLCCARARGETAMPREAEMCVAKLWAVVALWCPAV